MTMPTDPGVPSPGERPPRLIARLQGYVVELDEWRAAGGEMVGELVIGARLAREIQVALEDASSALRASLGGSPAGEPDLSGLTDWCSRCRKPYTVNGCPTCSLALPSEDATTPPDALRDRYEAALRRILAMDPKSGIDPNARVGDPNAWGWNVHDVAREALASRTPREDRNDG